MLNLVLWLSLLVGFVALVAFAWRSAMRRRGFRLLKMVEQEGVLRYAVDVPVAVGEKRPIAEGLARRGTLVLTRKRLAGFAHRSRFVLVRGAGKRGGAVRAEPGWLVVRPAGRTRGGGSPPSIRFRIPDSEVWREEIRRAIRI
jgi:hypothetical protein